MTRTARGRGGVNMKKDFLKFGNRHPFDRDPIVNHQCHWAPWADKFQDYDGDTGTLANMLGYSLEENQRLRERLNRFTKAHAALLFAFIELVETGKPESFAVEETPQSIKVAWLSIQQLNDWRRDNKLNIKAVDVT